MRVRSSRYENIVAQYEAGASVAEIAQIYGVSRISMWQALKRRGALFRPKLRYGTDNHFYRGSESDAFVQSRVQMAVNRGDLVPPETCESCGKMHRCKDGRRGIQAHHADYNKPLEVQWLCLKCHHEWHKLNKAIPRVESPNLDVAARS